MSALSPYTGTFGKPELLHLLRRTLFGVRKSDLAYFEGKSLTQVVNELTTLPTTAPAPPVNGYNTSTDIDPQVPLGETWINAPYTDSTFFGERIKSFKGWWISLMLNQERNIQEKMVLFWHNHFATETNVINIPTYVYKTNALLRANALGNFKNLVANITKDPGMLVYLNGKDNTKNNPNENYARELQELFTIGKKLEPHYTEEDVKEAARVLTGWRLTDTNYNSFFNLNKHDYGSKQFSSFYNNTVITGQNVSTTGLTELNALIDMIFTHPEVAKHLCRKFYRYFVYYDITPDVETNIIEPLATIFRDNNYDVKITIKTLLNSQHFFEMNQKACVIKDPTLLTVGFIRQTEIQMPAGIDILGIHEIWRDIRKRIALQQMNLGDPPNVAGWPAWYQVPNFHELWINADALRMRKNVIDELLFNNIEGNGYNFYVDVVAFTQQWQNPSNANDLVSEVLELFHPITASQATKDYLKTLLLSSAQSPDYYWTDLWENYNTNPGSSGYDLLKYRLKTFYQYICNMAEYHLC